MKRSAILYLLAGLIFFIPSRSLAGVENIPTGSFIINMGKSPQTFQNGLRPYGLIYDLLKNYNVPVKWVINPTKSKDGADFVHNGITYSGGTFIILQDYRTAAINTVITTWQSKGVVGATSVSNFSVEVFMTLLFAPNWTMDKDNGDIAVSYFDNAQIPSSAYGGSLSSSWKTPAQLGICDDIFVMPHADPTWATHNNLYYWNQNYKGNIWAACHAVSVMEAITNPPLTIKMNFLSSIELINFISHADGSPPYTYLYLSDPVAQFMGSLDAATDNGSEQIYLPLAGGGWRGTSKIITYDPTQANVPSISPGPAVAVIYGRAYGDTTRGWVMYESGHDHDKATVAVASRVAAQRAFFNFSFLATTSKSQVDVNMNNVPGVMLIGQPVPVGFTLPPGYSASNYIIKWTSSCGGTFTPSDNIQNTVFTPPNNPLLTSCVLSVSITDSCNRKNFNAKNVNLTIILLPLKLGELFINKTGNGNQLNWETYQEDEPVDFKIEQSFDAVSFSTLNTIHSTGISQGHQYSYTDQNSYDKTVYYRITAVDNTGRRYSTNIVSMHSLSSSDQYGYSIFPNPAKNKIVLRFIMPIEKSKQLTIMDQNGKIVLSKLIPAGTVELLIAEIKSMSSGLYFLKLSDGYTDSIKKLIIAR